MRHQHVVRILDSQAQGDEAKNISDTYFALTRDITLSALTQPPPKRTYTIALYVTPEGGGGLGSALNVPVLRMVFVVWNSGVVNISCWDR